MECDYDIIAKFKEFAMDGQRNTLSFPKECVSELVQFLGECGYDEIFDNQIEYTIYYLPSNKESYYPKQISIFPNGSMVMLAKDW